MQAGTAEREHSLPQSGPLTAREFIRRLPGGLHRPMTRSLVPPLLFKAGLIRSALCPNIRPTKAFLIYLLVTRKNKQLILLKAQHKARPFRLRRFWKRRRPLVPAGTLAAEAAAPQEQPSHPRGRRGSRSEDTARSGPCRPAPAARPAGLPETHTPGRRGSAPVGTPAAECPSFPSARLRPGSGAGSGESAS